MFRSVKSLKTNPKAIDRLGSGKFITYESCIDFQKANTQYLHPRVNIRKMYQLYAESCVFQNRPILSETIFRVVFKTNFELSLVKSQTLIQMDLTKTVEMSQSFGENIEVFTFELQKVMDLPYLSNSDVFFKKQLWLSILTICDEVRDITYNYVWDETIESRESDSIASCL